MVGQIRGATAVTDQERTFAKHENGKGRTVGLLDLCFVKLEAAEGKKRIDPQGLGFHGQSAKQDHEHGEAD